MTSWIPLDRSSTCSTLTRRWWVAVPWRQRFLMIAGLDLFVFGWLNILNLCNPAYILHTYIYIYFIIYLSFFLFSVVDSHILACWGVDGTIKAWKMDRHLLAARGVGIGYLQAADRACFCLILLGSVFAQIQVFGTNLSEIVGNMLGSCGHRFAQARIWNNNPIQESASGKPFKHAEIWCSSATGYLKCIPHVVLIS